MIKFYLLYGDKIVAGKLEEGDNILKECVNVVLSQTEKGYVPMMVPIAYPLNNNIVDIEISRLDYLCEFKNKDLEKIYDDESQRIRATASGLIIPKANSREIKLN